MPGPWREMGTTEVHSICPLVPYRVHYFFIFVAAFFCTTEVHSSCPLVPYRVHYFVFVLQRCPEQMY